MLVTIVCDVLGNENNGTTIAAMNLIRSLRAKGHRVRVVCPDAGRQNEEDFYVVPVYNFGPLNGYVAKNGVCMARAKKDVLEQAIEGADVVHVLIPFSLGCAAARIAHSKGIPVTAGFHCQAENFTNHLFLMNSVPINKLVYRIFYRKLYRDCQAVHYPSQFICDLFEKETGPTRHYVISNGVGRQFTPCEHPHIDGTPYTIVFTGRYSKEKSHKVLIDAVARCAHARDIQLIFAGSGPQEQKLRKYAAARLPVQPRFCFFSREELVDVLHGADLYVHPSEIEIEAVACLEAIACGLVPVISNSPRSATGGFALNPENLFRCGDADDLAKKIDWWLDHPERRAECSRQYAGYSERFGFDKCMDAMENMLLDAAGEVKAHA